MCEKIIYWFCSSFIIEVLQAKVYFTFKIFWFFLLFIFFWNSSAVGDFLEMKQINGEGQFGLSLLDKHITSIFKNGYFFVWKQTKWLSYGIPKQARTNSQSEINWAVRSLSLKQDNEAQNKIQTREDTKKDL